MLRLPLRSKPEYADAGNRPQTGGAAGHRLPVYDHEPDDFAEADGGHGQIVSAQAHGRQAEHQARGDHHDDGQKWCRDPGQAGFAHDCRGVGAKPIERGLPEIDLAGPTRRKIETEHDDGVENGDVQQLDDIAVMDNERNRQSRCGAYRDNGPVRLHLGIFFI